jgi:hypothetical protein
MNSASGLLITISPHDFLGDGVQFYFTFRIIRNVLEIRQALSCRPAWPTDQRFCRRTDYC